MQEDLLDAVEYVRAKGFADPARIAIYGGSYGGYAALVAATSGTTEFRCAVAVAAPSDLRTFLASIPPQWRVVADRLGRRIGDPVTEADFLWSRSPLAHVERLAVPLLIAQGANDPRVLRQESEQIVAELRRRGIPHEYLLFSDEGHGFVKPANRMRFYAAAERFLAQHLGGRAEPDDMA
jgi:dipeptidyl aminopeptidase/acylaminoacyl peptidase